MTDAISILGSVQGELAVSTTKASTPVLKPGIYDVWCDVECAIEVGDASRTIAADTGYPIFAGNVVPVDVPDASSIIAILASGTGTLKYRRVG